MGELVPFGGEHAFPAMSLHSDAKASHACKEVDKCEFRMFGIGEGHVEKAGEDVLSSIFRDFEYFFLLSLGSAFLRSKKPMIEVAIS